MGTVFGAVVAISDPAPRIRRLVFDVPSLADLGLPGDGDDAVGIYFPEPGKIAPPAMECRDGVWAYFDPDTAPHGRNYSIRTAGPGPRQITVDIVLHERGIASDFARSASIGDQVVLAHARSWYHPDPAAQWQLLVADLSGLPALARIIEEWPGDTEGIAIVEVADEADLAYLPSHPDVTLITSVGTGNGYAAGALANRIRSLEHPAGRGYCWFAAEASESRAVRKHLRRDHNWAREQYDIIGYWRFDSETWDEKFESMSDELVAVYSQALADGKGDKIASEEFDLALERVGL
ncbi:siderophore esterase [Williamsia sp. Leaf354]|jgi:NADPH-dependent ferric siderophore reductase|uniref:siderophore-interacting protein n=1 Tax=Williamsia sp. Leaf354 TaxID=1736349 RepID=UPI0006FC704D|nr:siderophore-interacting protein [Williamsia sp. Leaf354]KQR96592.1 siderophore esterase [Williamsia sp. Leaf354]